MKLTRQNVDESVFVLVVRQTGTGKLGRRDLHVRQFLQLQHNNSNLTLSLAVCMVPFNEKTQVLTVTAKAQNTLTHFQGGGNSPFPLPAGAHGKIEVAKRRVGALRLTLLPLTTDHKTLSVNLGRCGCCEFGKCNRLLESRIVSKMTI